MSGIVRWAAGNRLLALLATLAIVVFGVFAARRLPIDAVPDVTSTQVQVVTRAPALSATEVEQQITQPIEREMAGVPGLGEMRSITKLGISIVTLVFEDGTDTYFARALVSERLSTVRATIPPEVGRPELGPVSTALGEIYMFEVRADARGRTLEELRTIVEWQIAPRLRLVPGVVEVVGFGGAVKQYRVTLDPGRMAAHGVSPDQVREAIERDNRISGGGHLEHAGEQIVLRGDARFRGLEDIAQVTVRTDEAGIPVTVGQLGEIDTGPAPRQGAMTRDGRGEVVGASVLMLKGKNSRDVVSNVKKAIADVGPTLPAGVSIDAYYDRADFIDRVLATIAKNLSEGAFIVVCCLLLTLGSLRAGLLVAGAIPFSLLVGLIGLWATGYSGNVMSLGAVDFGIIVEGAVLTVEHAMTHGGGEADLEKRKAAIVHAIESVTRPALFVVAIILLTFLPLSTLEDVEGKMFRPVVFSLCFMLVGAMFYALVLIPAVAPSLLAKSVGVEEPAFARLARRAYRPVLDLALRRPVATLIASFGLTLALLGPAPRLGADFLPRVFEGSFAVDALRPPTTSLPQAIALGQATEDALREVPEVKTVVNRIGRPEGAVDFAGPESSDVFVILKERSEWRAGMTPDALATEVSALLAKRVPATVNAVSQPIEMRVNDLVAGVRSDVAVQIYGDDLHAMSGAADAIRRAIARVPGATDVRMEIPFGQPSVTVTVGRGRVARLGVAPSDVLDMVAMARAGLSVGQVREGERVFDLVLRMGGEDVETASDLARLPIATTRGGIVPVSMVAAVEEERTVLQVSREQMRRRLVVQANVRGRDMVSFVREAEAEVAKLALPRGVEVRWGGQFQSFARASTRLSLLVPVALGIIGLLLMVAFRSTKYAVVTLLGLPFAIAGGVFALWLRGLPFSIPAAVGFIALAGVSVTTGIVMTSNLLGESLDLPPEERVRRASLASLRARISTALIAAIGFVPAAIATGAGAEVQRPLATTVIGGLAVSLLVSLVALPAMLLFAARRDVPDDGASRTGGHRREEGSGKLVPSPESPGVA
jgi:cobalt-zinc-cadmium resistance protein CzcA